MTAEMNVAASAGTILVPMLVLPPIRPLFPYAVLMIALDAFNGINDL
jgi:hypothetical protein